MCPLTYLKIKKNEFFTLLEMEGFELNTIRTIYYGVEKIIIKISQVRDSQLLTENLLNSFDQLRHEKHQKKNVTQEIFEELLIKSLAQAKSYTYAYNWLAKERAEEQFPIKDITESELLELIASEPKIIDVGIINYKDYEKKEKKVSYYSTAIEKNFLIKLHTHCSEILTCSQPAFFKAVNTADFSRIEVKTIYKFQHLLFMLSKQMGEDWYTKAVKSKDWTKTVCSGHSKRLEEDLWRKQLDKMIPDPK